MSETPFVAQTCYSWYTLMAFMREWLEAMVSTVTCYVSAQGQTSS